MQNGQSHPLRAILIIWLCWALLVLGFQTVAAARVQLKPPDDVLVWTGAETMPGVHNTQPYLLEPFLNRQVAYDSEFYLSIAVAGYDDPSLRAVWTDPENPVLIWESYPQAFAIPKDLPTGRPYGLPENFESFSLNYAFFPFYPLMIRLLSLPLGLFGLNAIATATLAGVIVSLLGALGAMLALYDLTRETLEKSGAIRAAFYLIAFPTGFFLAMVHTEGLFVGLAFGSLALLKRKQWLGASLLAAGATLTRAVGGALIVPLAAAWLAEAIPWFRSRLSGEKKTGSQARWELLGKGLLALSPLVAFGIWYLLLGRQFHAVESAFFSRGALVIQRSWETWRYTFESLFDPSKQGVAVNIGYGFIILTVLLAARAFFRDWLARTLPGAAQTILNLALILFGGALVWFWWTNTSLEQRSFYYMVEFGATVLALTACAYTLRRQPGLALFSLMVVVISFFSGSAQGMHRYILGAPATFVMLGSLGSRDEAFDRSWTIGSLLLMGLFALLFGSNFWVG
ncbi:MAG: hypothetical protein WBM17_12280 [Anaerolineales bacterium]